MILTDPHMRSRVLTSAYFLMIFVEITAALIDYQPLIFAAHVALPILLLGLYFTEFKIKSNLMLTLLILQIISNVYFFFAMTNLYIYTLVSFILLRVLSLILVYKNTPERNYLHILTGTFPFMLIFFYLASVTSDVSDIEFDILIFQNILISILGGLSVVNYLKNDNRTHSLLLISTLLYIGLRFIVFIEHYFLNEQANLVYKPFEIILSSLATFSFYKFVLTANESNHANS
ncbi:MAG: hypothetical protein JST78_07060 [Bacteroidetes bacterium]|nr:hypothetical protein [Bacteroidota bacterium]